MPAVVFTAVIDAVFPPVCAGCGARGMAVCDACMATLAPAPSVPAPSFVDDWVALFAYDGVARELVARIKYRNARAVVPWLADALAAAASRRFATAPDVVTWAPTTTARRRARGFDHAEMLARRVARALDVPARPLLTRVTQTAQTGRHASERRGGVAFAPTPRALTATTATTATTVLLIDDVTTTGTTLSAAARALRQAGARQVHAALLARTPPGRAGRGPSHPAGGRFAPSAYTPAP